MFEQLYESSQRNELILIDGGFCNWHLRKDGQVTIREIIATRRGAGSKMFHQLLFVPNAKSIFAKCPSDLESNKWYIKKGFTLENTETIPNGRTLNHYRYYIDTHSVIKNAGNVEIIYCAAGSSLFGKIAIEEGFLSGAQMPTSTLYFRPYFIDLDPNKIPNRALYMDALKKHRPRLATVMDIENIECYSEALDWAHEAAEYVGEVIIIPKVKNIMDSIPSIINGKPVRIGYSVPTSHGKTTVSLNEFIGRPIHLLGGRPISQFNIAHAHRLSNMLNIVSIDTNYHQKVALHGCVEGLSHKPHGYQLASEGGRKDTDVPYIAFRRSCQNIINIWKYPIVGTQHNSGMELLL